MEYGIHEYDDGYLDGLQKALDLVNRAADYVQQHPDELDTIEVLARIITDIQTA